MLKKTTTLLADASTIGAVPATPEATGATKILKIQLFQTLIPFACPFSFMGRRLSSFCAESATLARRCLHAPLEHPSLTGISHRAT
jgi:hypothetical protein